MAGAPRPLIAVTGHTFALGRIERVLEPQVAASTWYLESVNRAGGLGAVVLPEELDPDGGAEAVLAGFDGLLLTGGVDVDPSLYGQDPDPHTYGCDLTRDRFEMGLLRAALETGRPVLAICRGLQLVNVAFGGTLHQHLDLGPDAAVRHGIPNGGGGSTNSFDVTGGSLLGNVLDDLRPTGRCHHHQAVAQVGQGLVVSALAGDGGVEGLELVPDARWPGAGDALEDPWLVAVQWHPEETTHSDVVQQRLFDRLVSATAGRCGDRR